MMSKKGALRKWRVEITGWIGEMLDGDKTKKKNKKARGTSGVFQTQNHTIVIPPRTGVPLKFQKKSLKGCGIHYNNGTRCILM